ncbi:Flp family type IVb pilin [Methylobacterium flocculans]|uniref:Flp family type IVb pilin n=1 Tax=Methylobacterium flocculans TaxID=2984843 RepID=UPI0021F26047|nr:Flp family type IVb pilin [Methylobacterium sp. FF17]
MRLSVLRFWTDRAGATAIEYGLIAGLTFLVIAGSLKLFAERMTLMYNYIGNSLAGAF